MITGEYFAERWRCFLFFLHGYYFYILLPFRYSYSDSRRNLILLFAICVSDFADKIKGTADKKYITLARV